MNSASHTQELERLLERFRANPEGRIFAPLADCYRKMERFEEALEVCASGLARHPRYTSARVILGKIHRDQGQDGPARAAFAEVLDIDPDNMVALRYMAGDAGLRGAHDQALKYWQQILALDPSDTQAEDELEALQKAAAAAEGPEVQAAPVEPEPVVDAKTTQAETAPAAETASEPTAKEPAASEERNPTESPRADATDAGSASRVQASSFATMTLADIYYEQGFKTKALEIYRQILATVPDDPDVKARVARIESDMASIANRVQPTEVASVEELERPMAEEPNVVKPPTPAKPAASSKPAKPAAKPVSKKAAPSVLSAGFAKEADPPTPSRTDVTRSPIDPIDAEREDFDHFKSWLGRMKARPV